MYLRDHYSLEVENKVKQKFKTLELQVKIASLQLVCLICIFGALKISTTN